MTAISNKSTDIVKVLLEAGADYDQVNEVIKLSYHSQQDDGTNPFWILHFVLKKSKMTATLSLRLSLWRDGNTVLRIADSWRPDYQ
jgi:ankyrin repeat protein